MKVEGGRMNEEIKDTTNTDNGVVQDSDSARAAEPADQLEAVGSVEEIMRELEAARIEASDWRDKFVRKMAEFDNFRKRTRQEMESQRQFVAELLITGLLPVMDDFDRMLAAHAGESNSVVKGVELIREKLWSFFRAHDVERIECRGKPFDPELQEAIMMRETPDFPAGTVLEEIATGYRMGERVIRHAQVVVSAEPDRSVEASAGESESSQADSES